VEPTASLTCLQERWHDVVADLVLQLYVLGTREVNCWPEAMRTVPYLPLIRAEYEVAAAPQVPYCGETGQSQRVDHLQDLKHAATVIQLL
jgi:hypothetical protein